MQHSYSSYGGKGKFLTERALTITYSHAHTYPHIHTQTHTRTYKAIHTQTNTEICTHIYTRAHSCMHISNTASHTMHTYAENLVAMAQASVSNANTRVFAVANTAQEAELMLGALEVRVVP